MYASPFKATLEVMAIHWLQLSFPRPDICNGHPEPHHKSWFHLTNEKEMQQGQTILRLFVRDQLAGRVCAKPRLAGLIYTTWLIACAGMTGSLWCIYETSWITGVICTPLQCHPGRDCCGEAAVETDKSSTLLLMPSRWYIDFSQQHQETQRTTSVQWGAQGRLTSGMRVNLFFTQ